ncbi:hypothetical protein ACFL46_00020 [Candidatus Neomarinimicrobiota bacterium]
MKTKSSVLIVLITLALLLFNSISAQETKTLMGSDTDISFIWGLDLKTASIKGDLGIGYDFYGGALLNNSILLGIAAGLNITHPKLNQGNFALFGQYTYKPENVLHYSGQLLLGTGSVKGYEREKSSAFDNLGNVTGPGFYFIEPGINVEFNLTTKSRLLIGLSYRYVTGLDEITFQQINDATGDYKEFSYDDTDLSTLYFNIGVKVGKY